MAYKKLVDMHVHTDNSPDGSHSTMFLCESAINNGLRAIAFTDHCEIEMYFEDKYDRVVRQAYFEVAKAKSAYRGNLLVLQGIELAQPHYNPCLTESILASKSYDIIVGSLHALRNEQDMYFLPSFEPEEVRTRLLTYFSELKQMIEWGKFNTLAHMTYPLRYFFARSKISVDLEEYSKEVDEVLSLLAEKNLALEINTAGLRQQIKKLSPEFPIVKRFRELGGKHITVGSDAHYAEHLAADFDEALEVAVSAGFKFISIYQNGQPVELPIETE